MYHIKQKSKKKGQSTVEYVLLFAAVIAILIVFLGPGGIFRETVDSAVNSGANELQTMADRMTGSR